MRVLVTGGAGFIGSALIKHLLSNTNHEVLNLDKLTYAGSKDNLIGASSHPKYRFVKADICDRTNVANALIEFQPNWMMHLAAESHVDRSIANGTDFIQTNIVGTHILLEAALVYWQALGETARSTFRFLHVSTDEVFGSLPTAITSSGNDALKPQCNGPRFTETSTYNPSSPYSASKAASDHLVRSWGKTHDLPILISSSSNTFGAYQSPEKLIPKLILSAIFGRDMPLYGNGEQIRDWLFVEDHVCALMDIISKGRIGESYNIGAGCELKNIEVARCVCRILGELHPSKNGYEKLITNVADRPGHDVHYGVDASKLTSELNWRPQTNFETGLRRTICWYLSNQDWCAKRLAELGDCPPQSGQARDWKKEDTSCVSL